MSVDVQPGVLGRLGLVGLDDLLEIPLLCALATGDPLLLVGPHGTAKTALVHRVAQALDLAHHTYDASKAMFEDVVGFPDPSSLAQGRVRYVPTPLSIWDKALVFIDELSRAAPSMQNKWLEIVRGRRLMGLPLDQLQHVFAAMNPPSYLGAHPLDDALAGRFAWIVEVPQVRDLDPEDVLGVIRAASSDDARLAPVLRPATTDARELGDALRATIAAIRAALPAVIASHDDAVCAWVAEVELGLASTDGALDGRRLGMLRRNLLCAIAAHQVLGLPVERVEEVSGAVLRASLPYPATGVDVSEGAIMLAESQASRVALGGLPEQERALRHIINARRPDERVARYLASAAVLTHDEHHAALSAILDPLRLERLEARGAPMAAALRAVDAVFGGDTTVPGPSAQRLLAWYAGASAIVRVDLDDHLEALTRMSEREQPIPPAELLAARLAHASESGSDLDTRDDPTRFERLVRDLRPAAEALLGGAR